MLQFLYTVLIIAGCGAFAAMLIFVSNKFFKSKEEENLESKIEALLPGVNCGACGLGSCAMFAKSLASKQDKISSCKLTIGEKKQKIENLLSALEGNESQDEPMQKAVVHCQGGYSAEYSNVYMGDRTCKCANDVCGGNLVCDKGCLGYCDCFNICPVGAIELRNGCAFVNDKCIGCGKCTNICPRGLVTLEKTKKAHVRCCKNIENHCCARECIRCGECAKACKFNAIIPVKKQGTYKIDKEKCVGCRACVKVCPNKCIEMNLFE